MLVTYLKQSKNKLFQILMKYIKNKILTYLVKPYLKQLMARRRKIIFIMNEPIFRFISKFKLLFILLAIWILHNLLYTLTALFLMGILGIDLSNFLDFISLIYLSIYNFLFEIKFNTLNWIYNIFNLNSVEKMAKNIEKHIEQSNIRINDKTMDSKNKQSLLKTQQDFKESNKSLPFRDQYKTQDIFKYIQYNSWDIITNKYFYVPILSITAFYLGTAYHREVVSTLTVALPIILNPIIEWVNSWFTNPSNGDLPDIDTKLITLQPDLNPIEGTNTSNTSPTSTGSITPTKDYNKYFG